ncbi:MAG: GNAT family N-acetyltransferase, partial [Clostridia bacterium]|nr:GNAT family N-acetyltransferase [Clostridia bacterium]
MELRRLKAEDYDSLLDLLNKVFSIKNQRQVDFEKDLPKMWARTDEQMGKHFGVFEDGKLVSALGVYPLPTIIDGEEFMFSTVGNIATDKEYEGKGYMSQLIDVAMQELKDIKADVSRLGGLRKRYN